MKLDVSVNEVELTNVGATGEFRIKNSAKAFKILSDGLYSNKIRAIIRELSCNAVDSHIAAGTPDVPFEVHLPSFLEPWFAVRDYGTGLDNEQVVNVYTTYFESTKTNSNDYIGALGLGSKSPFSYTENFTVTAVKSGTKRIYSAFINEMGIPCVAEMQSELTDEQNGVEVKFSVVDKYDYSSFRSEALQVFKWFKLKPNVSGVDNFTHLEIQYKEKDIVPGVHSMPEGRNGSIAVMGNIAYPLNKIAQTEKYFGGLAGLLECGLIIEFPIGALDFAASREELSYVPLTMKSIKDKLEALNAQLSIHIAEKANKITCEWARADLLRQEIRFPLFKEAVLKYVKDTKFALYDVNGYHGSTMNFKFKEADLKAKGLEVRGMRVNGMNCSRNGRDREYDNKTQTYIEMVHIPVEMDVAIVLNDLKTGCFARARYHFIHTPKSGGKYTAQVYCVSHDDKDVKVRQAHYDKFMKELHNPPTIIKASDLMKEVRVRDTNIGTQGIMMLKKRNEYHRGRQRPMYYWDVVPDEPDKKTKYYYVALENYAPVDKAGNHYDIMGLKAKFDTCGIQALADIQIYGVRKSRIKDIAPLKNWIWIDEKITEEMNKITTAHVEAIVASEMLDNYNTKVYTNWDAVKLLDKDSDYRKYLEKYGKVKHTYDTSTTNLVALCAQYGKTFVVDNLKQQITKEREDLYIKYPLLKYLTHSDVKAAHLAHYITLADKQEKV